MARQFTPIKNENLTENIYGPDHIGIQVTVNLVPGSRWTCTKSDRYFMLRKKGSGVVIRCTESALAKHFVEVEEV